jgi:DNA-binding transcriptional LysR family regulator
MPATIEELPRSDFVGYTEELMESGYKQEQVHNLPIGYGNVVFRSNSIVALLNAASAGIGLIELPNYIARGTNLVPVLPELVKFEREIWINVSLDFQFAERVKLVVGFVKKLIESDTAAGLI